MYLIRKEVQNKRFEEPGIPVKPEEQDQDGIGSYGDEGTWIGYYCQYREGGDTESRRISKLQASRTSPHSYSPQVYSLRSGNEKKKREAIYEPDDAPVGAVDVAPEVRDEAEVGLAVGVDPGAQRDGAAEADLDAAAEWGPVRVVEENGQTTEEFSGEQQQTYAPHLWHSVDNNKQQFIK